MCSHKTIQMELKKELHVMAKPFVGVFISYAKYFPHHLTDNLIHSLHSNLQNKLCKIEGDGQ